MEIVTGALSTLLPKLAVLLTSQYNLQKKLRDDITFLKAELESMQPVLERVSEAPITDKQIMIWAREVRELSYDIEDSIDKFMVHIEDNPSAKPRGFGGFIHKSLKLLTTAKLRHTIASEITGIKELVYEVASRHERYKIDTASFVRPDNTTIDPRLMGIYERTSKLVGISGPQDKLKELVMEPEGTLNRHLKVVSVVGPGGLGKTTLANIMYQQLREQFECHAFVSVSLNPDLKKILCSILRQVTKNLYSSIEAWPVDEIIYNTRLHLEDKRYIIILDDIWDKSAWDLIKCALVDNNCGSRIITTSRVLDVAASCCSKVDGCIYKLKPLSHDDSKKLFYRRIFGSEDSCLLELKEMSEKILRKCGGVPLAINTIASLLASKPKHINEWYSVHNSIGSGLVKETSVENMRKILSMSYYSLPSNLKACLLYLSIFPEDYTISRDQLIRRWISEGFIPGEDVVTSYEHAENYFSELINRSLIEPEYVDSHGRVLDCHVHDMILDLITSLSYDENFVTALHGGQLSRLPRWISSSLLCIRTLDMKLNTLALEDLKNLGAIVCLLDLCLMVLNDETERLVVGVDRGEFQCLVRLSFVSNAMRIIFSKQAMPRLENLELALEFKRHATIRIDCWGSSVDEVERANAAIQRAVFLNPNHPKLDVIRHFYNDMVGDDEIISVHDDMNEIEEEILADKMGPWGGNGGVAWDIKVASCHLESVTICSGTIIDAISFSYRDGNGRQHTTQYWGGTGGSAYSIRLGATEFLREVSGTVRPFFSIPSAVTSLRSRKTTALLVSFGRSGAYLHALGVYVRPV
ncbi:unnamed protein product [Miscanthus lutarioriparius]|uniref:Jacalin-type lectin domain-containing protein n=1 Tax=Miscanthus lutarioriparius TaxID=422564 RepID=A0A811RGK5_9POAL|nr:unnamed protein product [Miscanthus lutarioriparius]